MPDYAQFGNYGGQNPILSAFSSIGPSILWLAFAGCLIVFAVFNRVLSYHWNKFSLTASKTWWVVFIYTGVSLLLLAVMLFSILRFSTATAVYPY